MCFLKWRSFTGGCENEGYLKARVCVCIQASVAVCIFWSQDLQADMNYPQVPQNNNRKKGECGPPVLHRVQEIDSDA